MRGVNIIIVVVLAVLGLVAMVRFVEPLLKRKQEERLQKLCEARLAVLIVRALQNYITEYDNLLPPAPNWCDALETYIPPSQRPFVFHCPKLEEQKGYGFAMNTYAWDEKWKSPRWLPDMYPDDKVVLFYETKQTGRNQFGKGDDIPDLGRHNGMNLFLFANGSAIWLTPEEFREMKERGELLFKPLPRPPTLPLPSR